MATSGRKRPITIRPPEKLQFQALHETACNPARATDGAAGYDLSTTEQVTVSPRRVTKIDLGLAVAIPEGWVGFLRLRSGMGRKYGITMVTSGVIDSDYRGSLQAYVTCHARSLDHTFAPYTRMFQLVVMPCCVAPVEMVDDLDETERGEGGFGSTGED